MTPAAELTAAADRLDALLAEATPGPWVSADDGLVWPFERLGDPVSGSELVEDAAYIAAMNPDVGQALIALLRHLGELFSEVESPIEFQVIEHELALARAILATKEGT